MYSSETRGEFVLARIMKQPENEKTMRSEINQILMVDIDYVLCIYRVANILVTLTFRMRGEKCQEAEMKRINIINYTRVHIQILIQMHVHQVYDSCTP